MRKTCCMVGNILKNGTSQDLTESYSVAFPFLNGETGSMNIFFSLAKPAIILTGLILLQTSPAFAFPPGHVVTDLPDSNHVEDHTLGMLLGGTSLGTLGFFSGALIGASISDHGSEFDGIEEALIVGSIFGGLALPTGVHWGNKKQGDFSKVMATSLAVAGLGWLILWQTEMENLLVGLPFVQLVSCMYVESSTISPNQSSPETQQAGKISDPPIHVNLVPTRDGMGLFFSGTF